MKKIIVVGGGPAGLFAANELAENFQVIVIDEKSEIGGSGLHSDGKLMFHPNIGGDLNEFLSMEESEKILEEIYQLFENCGVTSQIKYQEEKLEELEKNAAKADIKFVPVKQKHIGSDRLPEIIKNFREMLEKKGVKFFLGERVEDIKVENGYIHEIKTKKRSLNCDGLLLAPGRAASSWMKEVCEKIGIKMKFNPIDIGVRVETSAKIMEDVTHISWEAKFYIRTKTYDDFLRTFCVCPYGFVTVESYGDSLFGVNGFSMYEKRSKNTNFALLVKVALTHPLEDTTEYGKLIVSQTNVLGGRKPLIQRLGELRSGKRSTWERISRSHIQPTLKDVTPGDISMAYPHRIIQNILEGLDMLDKVIPGINANSTLLYAPEVKFYARRIETNKFLQTSIPNLFVAGDGAGVSRGIVGAAATGIIAARGIKHLL